MFPNIQVRNAEFLITKDVGLDNKMIKPHQIHFYDRKDQTDMKRKNTCQSVLILEPTTRKQEYNRHHCRNGI